MLHNPYNLPAAQDDEPSLAPTQPEVQRGSRSSWVVQVGALMVINLLYRIYLQLWHQASFAVLEGGGTSSERLFLMNAYGMYAGNLLSMVLVALLGDGHRARPLLLGGILLGPLASLLLFVPELGPTIAAVDAGLMQLGTVVVALLVISLVLRAVTVRGAFVAQMLLALSEQVADMASHGLSRVLDETCLKLIGAAGASTVAILPWLWIRDVRSLRVSDGAPDPLARAPLSRGGGLLLVGLVAAALTLADLFDLRELRYEAERVQRGLEVVRHLVTLAAMVLVPLVAYHRAWSPRGVLIGGTVTTAAGGGLLGGGLLIGGLAPLGSTTVKTIWAVGNHGVMGIAGPVLLRQGLPVDRLVRWFTLYNLVSTVLWVAARTLMSLMSAAGILALAATGGLLLLAAGLWGWPRAEGAARG